jgi:hypothetical protein
MKGFQKLSFVMAFDVAECFARRQASSAPSHANTRALMMLGQDNQTKHLNVCLVQHRLEEGSEVV